jgi:hypothetical protein
MPKCTCAGNILDSSARATPPIISEVVQKHEYLFQMQRPPAVPVLDPYRYPLPQFAALIDVRRRKDSLEYQILETIICIWPKAGCEVRFLGSCWRALTSATIVVWADQPFGQAGTRPRLRGKERIWKARSEMRNHRRDLERSRWGFC